MEKRQGEQAKRRKNVVVTYIDSSYLCRGSGFGLWRRSNVFSQRFTLASRGRKRVRRIHALHGHSRRVPGVRETPNEQCLRRLSDLLFGGDRVADRQARRRGNAHLRLGRASGCI